MSQRERVGPLLALVALPLAVLASVKWMEWGGVLVTFSPGHGINVSDVIVLLVAIPLWFLAMWRLVHPYRPNSRLRSLPITRE
jgi:hypothetical protein